MRGEPGSGFGHGGVRTRVSGLPASPPDCGKFALLSATRGVARSLLSVSVMRRSGSGSWVGVLAASVALLGCGAVPDSGDVGANANASTENVGSITFELNTVPNGVGCVRIVVTGSTTVTSNSATMAGTNNYVVNMDRLPLGPVTITGAAYASSCGTGAALYVADTALATIETGVVTTLPLTFRKNNAVLADVNFVGNITKLAAGAGSNALVVDGNVYVWGQINGASAPTLVNALSNVVDVQLDQTLGKGTACALKADGTVWCWGDNSSLQAGVASPATIAAPTLALGGESGFTALYGGGLHFCGFKAALASVKCWGSNSRGQLGIGSPASSATPLLLPTGVAVKTAALGGQHSCVIDRQLSVYCLGYNFSGQLGDGTNTDTPFFTSTHLGPAVSLAGGKHHSCAVLADGTARCWGNNGSGQLGDATTTSRNAPVAVSALTGVVSMGAGATHTCALTATGEVKCWGANDSGQLGDVTTTYRSTPTSVRDLPGPVEMLAVGHNHNCAVTEAHDLYCWGANTYGELGDGTTVVSVKPIKVRLP